MDRIVGRERERAAIRGWLDTAGTFGRALVLVGEPGVGITTLLDAAATDARSRWPTVVVCSGRRSAAAAPYAGLAQFARALHEPATPALHAMLAHDPDADPGAVAAELSALLESRTAVGPVLLVADDLHRMDQGSRAALDGAVRVGSAPVALLAGAHGGDPPLEHAGELLVEPLAPAEARRLVDRDGGGLGAAVRDRILADARGNPLALVELAAAWREVSAPGADLLLCEPPMTARLRRALVVGAAELPPTAATVLLVAALSVGGEVTEVLAAAGLVANDELTAAALDPCVAAGLLTLAAGRVRFCCELVRAGVVVSARPGELTQAHTALEIATERLPDRRTWHRAAAATLPDERVAAALEVTATTVCSDAPVEALRRLELAARLSPDRRGRGSRMLAAAAAALDLGRPDVAGHLIATAARDGLGDTDRIRIDAMQVRFRAASPAAGQPLQTLHAAAEWASTGGGSTALDSLVAAAVPLYFEVLAPGARERILGALPAGDDPRLTAVRAIVAPLTATPDEPSPAAAALPAADLLWLRGLAAQARGASRLAADLLGGAAAELHAVGRDGLLTQVQGLRAEAALAIGSWTAAEDAAAACLRLATRTDQPMWRSHALICAALLAALWGDGPAAARHATKAERLVVGDRSAAQRAHLRLVGAVAQLSAGDYPDACAALHELLQPDGEQLGPRLTGPAIGYLAEAAVHCERGQQAQAVVDRYERLTGGGVPALVMHLRAAAALLATRDGDAEARFTLARQTSLEGWPWLAARLDLAAGAWLRRRRRVTEARTKLRSALLVFEDLGARPWSQRARAELAATGIAGGETGALTPQELQIVRLAAAGLSNRQIGDRLFLSHRTIGSHLYRIFPKLNVTSRSQLAHRIGALPGRDGSEGPA